MASYLAGASLVGREEERAQIRELLGSAQGGRGGTFLVEGGFGMGVSRLLEWGADAAVAAGFRLSRSEAREGDSAPYAPFLRLLEEGLEAPPPRPGDRAELRLPLALAGAPAGGPGGSGTGGGRAGEDVGSEWGGVPLGLLLAPVATGWPSIEELPPAGAALQVVERLQAISAGAPLLLTLDQFQWAAPSSWEALRTLSREVRRRPWSLLVGFETPGKSSPEETGGAGGLEPAVRAVVKDGGGVRSALQGLSVPETLQLCQDVLGGPLLLDGRGRLPGVLAKAGGNPFFLHEVLRTGVRDGWIVRRPTGFQVTAPPEGERAPTQLRWWVGRRLAALTPEERTLIEAIAVLGGEFDPRAVAALLPEGFPPVRSGLERLERRHGLVRPVRPGTWRVTPEFLLPAVRSEMAGDVLRRLHGLAGAWLVEHEPGELDRIAHHFVHASDPGRGFPWLHRAWERALDRDDYGTALRLCRQGSALARGTRDPVAESTWRRREAQGLLGMGDVAASVRVAEDAFGHAPAGMPRVELALELARLEVRRGHRGPSMAFLTTASQEPVPPDQEAGRKLLVAERKVLFAGLREDWEEVRREVPPLLAAPQGLSERSRLDLMTHLGAALASAGEFEGARKVLVEALIESRRSHRAHVELNAQDGLIILACALGDLAVARALCERGIDERGTRGATTAQAVSAENLTEILLKLGELEEAGRRLRQSLDLCEASGLTSTERPFLLSLQARTELEQGHPELAERTLAPLLASEELRMHGELFREDHALMASILMDQGRNVEAMKVAEGAGPGMEGQNGAQVACILARCRAKNGQTKEAERRLGEVISATASSGRKFERALALWELGEVLRDQGRRDEARARWDESLGLLRACGALARAARLEPVRRALDTA